MEKQESLYLVTSYSGRKLHIWATSSGQAKQIYCREYGIRPSDAWCGVTSLSARELQPAEVEAWEEQAGERRATCAFIKGALDICAKACVDFRCG